MFTPVVSAQPPFASYGDNNSWIKVNHDLGTRPLYAQAVYNVNPSNSLGMNGFNWINGNVNPGTYVGPFVAVLLTTVANNETHAQVASITSTNNGVASGFSVLAGTYIYNVKAITITSTKTGAVVYY